jgi:hypothetical protein
MLQQFFHAGRNGKMLLSYSEIHILTPFFEFAAEFLFKTRRQAMFFYSSMGAK